ncbi:MAG: hypothetical protein IPI58_03300 [Alphaproteobacteria bacterium]|nr:MAG: hypothetical protein IPI58_03300 [Alphaproteobacteria bacterium]
MAEDIFAEVDEALQREKVLTFFKRNRILIAITVVGSILVAASIEGGSTLLRHQRETETGLLLRAMEETQGQPPAQAAARWDDVVRQLSMSGFLTVISGSQALQMARMQSATAHLKAGDVEQGVTAFSNIANDEAVDPLWRSTARLLASVAVLDTADPQDLRQRLEPLAAQDAPLRHTARLMLALLDIQQGKHDAAAEQLRKIDEDSKTPGHTRQQAKSILRVLTSAHPGIAATPVAPAAASAQP